MSTLRQVNSPWIEGYDFGVGVDLMSGSPMNLAVVDQHSNAGGAGATVGFRVSQVRSTSDLEQSLGIDVDASYGSVMFGAGVKARFDFAKSSAIQSTSLFMAVTATVQLAFESIDAPALTGTAGQTVDRQDIFEARFGNMFVRGMRHGGLFVGMMQVETQHEGDALGISGQLAGAYGFFSADVQAKFKQTIERFGASVFCTMYHEGGPVNLHINDPSNPTELLQNANAFLDSFSQNPSAVAQPYSVTLAPLTIATGPLPLNAAQIEQAQDVLVFCAKRRSALTDQLNLLQYIADNPSKFDFSADVPLPKIVKAASDTEDDLDLIAACASNAINDPAHAVRPDKFAEQQQSTFPKAIMPDPIPTRKLAPAGSSIDGVWRPDDNNFDVGQLEIASTGPGQASVVVTFRHGPNAPIVKSTTATLDVNTNTYRTPVIVKQDIRRQIGVTTLVEHLLDTHEIAFSNEIVGNKTFVTQTVVHPGLTGATSDVNLTSVFTRQL